MWHLHVLSLGAMQLRIGPTKRHVDDLGLDKATGSPFLMTILNYTHVSNASDVMVVGSKRIPLRSDMVVKIPYKVEHSVEAASNSRREFDMTYELDMAAVEDPIALIGKCGSTYGIDGTSLTYDECRIAISNLKTGNTTSSLTGDGCFVTVNKYATRLHFTSVQTGTAIPVTKCGRIRRDAWAPSDEVGDGSSYCTTHADCPGETMRCATTVYKKQIMVFGYPLEKFGRTCIDKADCADRGRIVAVGTGDFVGSAYVCGDERCVNDWTTFYMKQSQSATSKDSAQIENTHNDNYANAQQDYIFSRLVAKSVCNDKVLNEKQCREHANAQGGQYIDSSELNLIVSFASAGCYSFGTELDQDKCKAEDGSCPLSYFYTDGCHTSPEWSKNDTTSSLKMEEICEEDSGWSTWQIVGVSVASFLVLLLVGLFVRRKILNSRSGKEISTSFL